MEILHEWNFPNCGVLQLVEDKERASYSSITMMVANRDDQVKKLEKLNITIESQGDSNIANVATIKDPEDNRITFAEKVMNQ